MAAWINATAIILSAWLVSRQIEKKFFADALGSYIRERKEANSAIFSEAEDLLRGLRRVGTFAPTAPLSSEDLEFWCDRLGSMQQKAISGTPDVLFLCEMMHGILKDLKNEESKKDNHPSKLPYKEALKTVLQNYLDEVMRVTSNRFDVPYKLKPQKSTNIKYHLRFFISDHEHYQAPGSEPNINAPSNSLAAHEMFSIIRASSNINNSFTMLRSFFEMIGGNHLLYGQLWANGIAFPLEIDRQNEKSSSASLFDTTLWMVEFTPKTHYNFKDEPHEQVMFIFVNKIRNCISIPEDQKKADSKFTVQRLKDMFAKSGIFSGENIEENIEVKPRSDGRFLEIYVDRSYCEQLKNKYRHEIEAEMIKSSGRSYAFSKAKMIPSEWWSWIKSNADEYALRISKSLWRN